MFRHIVAVRQKLEIVLPRQVSDESLIRVRLLPAQIVIEMNDAENNPEFTTQFQQQPQKRNRINPAGNSNSNAISGMQQIMPPNVGKYALCQGVHGNMVQLELHQGSDNLWLSESRISHEFGHERNRFPSTWIFATVMQDGV